MPENFREHYNAAAIAHLAEHITRVHPRFDTEGFLTQATNQLDDLALKARVRQIADALTAYLPDAYNDAVSILLATLAPEGSTNPDKGVSGWMTLPLNTFVSDHGLTHFDRSLEALKALTPLFSAEEAIRFFIVHDQDRTLEQLRTWTADSNHHVRRLVSEGTRPRLPWAMHLHAFQEDPTPILPLLNALKDDPSEYVRRSVANNLNDMAKDHPDLVVSIIEDWLVDASPARKKLIRHACRTLIKQGHQGCLHALGYTTTDVTLSDFQIHTPTVIFGNALTFEATLTSMSDQPQNLIVDYIIHHVKANGSTSPKVFKWKTLTLPAQTKHTAQRNHKIRPITTRVYYPGTHRIEVVANGQVLGGADFELVIPPE